MYSFTQGEITTYGMMFYAEIETLGDLKHEIKELMMTDDLPQNLTYKQIQPFIFEETLKILKHKD